MGVSFDTQYSFFVKLCAHVLHLLIPLMTKLYVVLYVVIYGALVWT